MQPAPQRSRHLSPGDKLGKYDLIRQIAIGGMAELYLARTVGIEGFEKLVVVKRILPQFATNANFVNMFLNEARLAATLQHPNVAAVYDIGVEDGDYFFAMEYVHGEDLDRMSTQSNEQGVPISMDAALTLIAGLCAGLHYAHDKVGPDGKPLQIVHRDVSPSNVLVSYDGSVKLVDFGIARAFAGKSSGKGNQTQGGLKGKITYMSPEQCRSDAVLDRRSDIYSIGTLLYELTAGRVPFTGETEYAILNSIVNVDVPPPTRFVPGYPPALERIVLRALARDPDRRYSTAVELQGELEDFAHENRLRVSPLVLARLMGTLFPTKLEEWDNAKSQGAFFVEQHVVRTLIESGRTPDPNDPAVRAQVKQLATALREDDPTALDRVPIDGSDTTVGPPPIAPAVQMRAPRMKTPAPHQRPPTPHPGRMTPVPNMPGAVPIMPAPQPPQQTAAPMTPGTLVSHPTGGNAVVARVPSQFDVTERVHVPRLATPTNLVRGTKKKSRMPLIAVTSLVLAGGGIAGFVAFGNQDKSPNPTTAPVVDTKPELKQPAVKVEPDVKPEVKPAVDDVKVVAPDPGPEPIAPEVTPEVEPKTAKKEPPKAHKVVHATPKKKPKVETKPADKPAEPKPEEKPWNADSPFMPVRTDKH